MNAANDTEALAEALKTRAQRLAEEERRLAEHERRRLLDAARERIARRRQQAERRAALRAEQHYRRLVQRAEQEIRARLEKLRWTLIQSVLADLRKELATLAQERPGEYRELLRVLLGEGCRALPREPLEALLNEHDHSTLQAHWAELAQPAGCEDIVLGEERCECSGGVLLRTRSGNARLDNTFEARLGRLQTDLAQAIEQSLFGSEGSEVNLHAG